LSSRAEHTCYKTSDGTLATSLAEDVLSLLETQRSVLWSFIKESDLIGTDAGLELFVDGMIFCLTCLKQSQMCHRLVFLTTLEDSMASANDYFRMSERLEKFVREMSRKYVPAAAPKACSFSRNTSGQDYSEKPQWQQLGDSLVSQFSQDAVYAAERAQVFILRFVQKETSIPSELFSNAWEIDWTHNEVTARLLKISDDYLRNVHRYLCNEYLYHKALIISARAIVCFYVRCLVQKAESIGRMNRQLGDFLGKRGKPFQRPKRAVVRMRDDLAIITEYFEGKAKGNPVLKRMIRKEVGTLEVIQECLGAGDDLASLESFIVVIHKRTGADSLVTRYFVGDLYLLVTLRSNEGRCTINHALDQLQPDLQMVTTRMNETRPVKTDSELSFVRLDEMLRALYEDRIAQGLLPICWTCLPKDIVQDSDENVLARRIRSATRNISELRWGRKQACPKQKP
jgi:hypothetical protein